MVDTLSSVTIAAKEYYDKKLLMRALPELALPMFGQQRNIPKRGGNSVSYRRYNTLSTATTALTEGVTPTADAISSTEVTKTVAQYGNYVEVSDQLDMMGIDPVISEMTEVLGENGGQSIEEIIRAELVTGTNVIYATGSSRGGISASNPLTTDLVRKAVKTLHASDAKPHRGTRNQMGHAGMYVGYTHPNTWYDMLGGTDVENTFQYSDPEKFYTLNLEELQGVAFAVSTKAPVFAGEGSGGADVYGTFIFGKEAYGVVNVANTGKYQTIVKNLGSGGTADPLDQRATIGWKSLQAPKILNNNFMVRIETGTSA